MRKMLQNNNHYQILFYIAFFSPLLGISGLWFVIMSFSIIYAFYVNKHRKIGFPELILTILFILCAIIKLFHFCDISIWFPTIKYYMGIGIVICFLYLLDIVIDVNKLIIALNIEIFIEAILINTVLPANYLPNYPDLDYLITTGQIARVYSVGCNASKTATILTMLLSYREIMRMNRFVADNRIIEVISFISIIVLGSGVGFLLYILYLIFKYQLLRMRYIIFCMILMYFLFQFSKSISMNQDSIFQRFSYEYFEYILDYKKLQIDYLIQEYNVSNKIFGSTLKNVDDPIIWGDFAWIEYYISVGLFGIVVFLLTIYKYINNMNWFPVFIGILGAFHYGGIFSLPGQMVFAYVLLLNKKTLFHYSLVQSNWQ